MHTATRPSRDQTTSPSESSIPCDTFREFRWLTGCLSRHRRTHERADGTSGEHAYGSYSEEDLDGDEDQLGSLEESSPGPDTHLTGYGQHLGLDSHAMGGVSAHIAPMPPGMGPNVGLGMNMNIGGMAAPSQLIGGGMMGHAM